MILDAASDLTLEDTTQHKRHSVALTARVTATDFNHKVHAMS